MTLQEAVLHCLRQRAKGFFADVVCQRAPLGLVLKCLWQFLLTVSILEQVSVVHTLYFCLEYGGIALTVEGVYYCTCL